MCMPVAHLSDVSRKVELVDAAQDDVVDLHGVGRRERWSGK